MKNSCVTVFFFFRFGKNPRDFHITVGTRRSGGIYRIVSGKRRGSRSKRYRGQWKNARSGNRHDGGQQFELDHNRETRQSTDGGPRAER